MSSTAAAPSPLALIGEAIYAGLAPTVRAYLGILAG